MKSVFATDPPARPETEAATVRRLVSEAADSVGALVADHIRLARAELAADARIYAVAASRVVGAALLALVGALLASAAAALGLAPVVGMPVAFGLVAVGHFALAGLCIRAASAKVRRTQVMRETIAEARRSVRAVVHPAERTDP